MSVFRIPLAVRQFAGDHYLDIGKDERGYFIRDGEKIYRSKRPATSKSHAIQFIADYVRKFRSGNAATNPVPDSSAKKGRKARVNQAERLFEDFSGHFPGKQFKIPVPDDDVALAFGKVIAIQYETIRDGKHELYQHDFRSKSRPLLAASSDGYQLYLLGGKYQFTDRGIVDK